MKVLLRAFYIFFLTVLLVGVRGIMDHDRSFGHCKFTPGVAFARNFGERDGGKLTKFISPRGFVMPAVKERVFKDRGVRMNLYSKNFAQGNAVYIEVLPWGKKSPELHVRGLFFGKKEIPLTKKSWGWRGLLGIHPELKPGYREFLLKYSQNGMNREMRRRLYISDVKYPVSRKSLNLGKFSSKNYHEKPKFQKLIKTSAVLKRRAFKTNSFDKLDNTLSHPRDFHKITGLFWKKRIYLYHKKNKKGKVKKWTRVSFHRGLDFKGAVGAPIFSIARGKVVLASKMFFEGNMVVVDHGKKVFSYYMHMSSLGVKRGDSVSAGDFLGRVGATGMVTGPHLHLAVMIRGVHVDPLSFICLPIRE